MRVHSKDKRLLRKGHEFSAKRHQYRTKTIPSKKKELIEKEKYNVYDDYPTDCEPDDSCWD